jgi:hypothetical protein
MSLDLTGATLAKQLVQALNIPEPPINPTPAQQSAYEAAVAAQLSAWTTISSQILTYLKQNTVVAVGSNTGTIS